MRITRENVEALVSAIEQIEDASGIKDACQSWLDGQDEEPKTEDVREQIRDARESIEAGLDELLGAAQDIVDLLNPMPNRKAAPGTNAARAGTGGVTMTQANPSIQRCGAVPPIQYRDTACCLLKPGHRGPHRNGLDQITWPKKAEEE